MNKHYCKWDSDEDETDKFYLPECCKNMEMIEVPVKIPKNNICPYCGLQIKEEKKDG